MNYYFYALLIFIPALLLLASYIKRKPFYTLAFFTTVALTTYLMAEAIQLDYLLQIEKGLIPEVESPGWSLRSRLSLSWLPALLYVGIVALLIKFIRFIFNFIKSKIKNS